MAVINVVPNMYNNDFGIVWRCVSADAADAADGLIL
jgi:hypothetical protein